MQSKLRSFVLFRSSKQGTECKALYLRFKYGNYKDENSTPTLRDKLHIGILKRFMLNQICNKENIFNVSLSRRCCYNLTIQKNYKKEILNYQP